MTEWYMYAIAAAAAYILGCFNGALMVSLWFLRDDIRKHGSGNAGLTNTFRVFGPRWAAFVLLWDAAKGVAAVLLAGWLIGSHGALIAGVLVIIGHIFPMFFRFKGGKGIMTACGVLFSFHPIVAAIALGCFILAVLTTRYVSLGSIIAVVTLAPLMWLFSMDIWYIATSGVIAAVIIFMHRANVGRLLSGTERRFSFKRT